MLYVREDVLEHSNPCLVRHVPALPTSPFQFSSSTPIRMRMMYCRDYPMDVLPFKQGGHKLLTHLLSFARAPDNPNPTPPSALRPTRTRRAKRPSSLKRRSPRRTSVRVMPQKIRRRCWRGNRYALHLLILSLSVCISRDLLFEPSVTISMHPRILPLREMLLSKPVHKLCYWWYYSCCICTISCGF